jgi:hypothetical protein
MDEVTCVQFKFHENQIVFYKNVDFRPKLRTFKEHFITFKMIVRFCYF